MRVDLLEVAVLTNKNKELTCFCLRDFEVTRENKNTKRYIKVGVGNIECFGYNGVQPKYLFQSDKGKSNAKDKKTKNAARVFARTQALLEKSNQGSKLSDKIGFFKSTLLLESGEPAALRKNEASSQPNPSTY